MFRNRKSSGLILQEVNSNIIKLKEGMNSKRENFVLPEDHSIVITGNSLVGFLSPSVKKIQICKFFLRMEWEGDGSFYLNKHDMTVRVSLVTTTVNRLVLEKIR